VIGLGIFVASAASAAANMIFKALLYSYATGKSLPENLNTADYSMAFVAKN
jgi:hydrogenase/urease accessory protein HupE